MTQDLDKLKEHLHRLASKAIQVAEKALEDRRIQPHEEPYFKWKIRRFKYTEEGISYSQAEGQYILKKSWNQAVFILSTKIANTKEYKTVLKLLPDLEGARYPTEHLDKFLAILLKRFLEDKDFGKKEVDDLVETFINDIEGKPISFSAKVELYGITLAPKEVNITNQIRLRRPTKEDLEIEIPVYDISVRSDLGPRSPSAIMLVDIMAKDLREVQSCVRKAVGILRLFKTGGVDFNYCKTVAKSLRYGTTREAPILPKHPIKSYVLLTS